MPRTIGYHYVKTTYGTWLPGDPRGHWSSVLDPITGHFVEHRQLHDGQQRREELSRALMLDNPTYLDAAMMEVIEETLAKCQRESSWKIAAGSIERTHLHLLITYSGRPIEQTAKWLAQQMTSAIHERTAHQGPVWTSGYWAESITDEQHWQNAIRYIEAHNLRRGAGPRPYSFLARNAGDGVAGTEFRSI